MNLWDNDIVNMPKEQQADAATFLVADIDKGGVFASLYGSVKLLPDAQPPLLKCIIITNFRRDMRRFDDGLKIPDPIPEAR